MDDITRPTHPCPPSEPEDDLRGLLRRLSTPVDHVCGCGTTYRAPPMASLCDACVATEEAKEESARAAAFHRQCLTESGIPSNFRWAEFGHEAMRARTAVDVSGPAKAIGMQLLDVAMGRATDYAATPVLCVAGPAGSGKTSVACAILRGVMRRGTKTNAGWFVGATRLELEMRSHRLGTELGEAVHKAISRSIVVIDDVGQETFEPASATIRDIVHNRHEEGRATIVTTGLGFGELCTRYGQGFARRVVSGGLLLMSREPKWGGYSR